MTLARKIALMTTAEPASLVADHLNQLHLQGWTIEKRNIWTLVSPPLRARRMQGWKLHVSATMISAPTVLKRCLPILIKAQVQFKFASTSKQIMLLNDLHSPRGQSGKFLTVYPESDTSLRHLASALHRATAGLQGPRILSDSPYRKGSL